MPLMLLHHDKIKQDVLVYMFQHVIYKNNKNYTR